MNSHEAAAPEAACDPIPDLTIVVPTYREVENLGPLAERIFGATAGAGLSAEMIVVDDDSQDGTETKCRLLASRFNIRLITRQGVRGLATAALLGMTRAQGRVLVCMDADLSHPPEAIPAMAQALKTGADFVIASRYVRGAEVGDEWGHHRWLLSRLAILLARPLTSVSDPTTGFFALRRDDFGRAVELTPLGYKVALELLVKLKPGRIVEIPIRFEDRQFGQSKLSVRTQIEYLRHLRRLYRREYPLFLKLEQNVGVGALGLVVDFGVYASLQAVFGLGHLLARSLAFFCAATNNWFFNPHDAFRYGGHRPPLARWASYWLVVLGGFVVNVGTYAALTTRTHTFADRRYLAMLMGILVGTGLNVLALRFHVFFQRPARAEPPAAGGR